MATVGTKGGGEEVAVEKIDFVARVDDILSDAALVDDIRSDEAETTELEGFNFDDTSGPVEDAGISEGETPREHEQEDFIYIFHSNYYSFLLCNDSTNNQSIPAARICRPIMLEMATWRGFCLVALPTESSRIDFKGEIFGDFLRSLSSRDALRGKLAAIVERNDDRGL